MNDNPEENSEAKDVLIDIVLFVFAVIAASCMAVSIASFTGRFV